MSSGTEDTATLARQWIETHAALFAVLIICAVLLIVVAVTVLVYCCCCRRKRSSWGAKATAGSKSTGSNLHIELHGDSIDASSAVTATIRGTHVVEIQVEKENQYSSQTEQPPVVVKEQAWVSALDVAASHEASLEAVQLQQSSNSELRAEFPPLPSLPGSVEVTSDAELRLAGRTMPEIEADLNTAVSASIARSAPGPVEAELVVETAEPRFSMRLPRTEVVLQTEIEQPQRQLPLLSSPLKATSVVASAKVTSPETVTVRSVGDVRPSHEHRHGTSIYQSDDNEITIVDSDFSDYEDTPEDQARKRATKLNSQLSIELSADVSADVNANFGWETLPNQAVRVKEPPIRAVDRHGEEYIPAPSPSVEEQQMRREQNLAELDRTLDVFEVEADSQSGASGSGVGFGFGLSVGGRANVGAEFDLQVDEEAIEPLDRSQVPH